MYRALGDYERAVRDRKFEIAEREDRIANLKEMLKKINHENDQMERKCELQEMEFEVEAARYSSELKEKEKLLAKRDALVQQCESAAKTLEGSRAHLSLIKSTLESRKVTLRAMENEFTAECTKYPEIAALISSDQQIEDLKKELEMTKEQLKRNQAEFKSKIPEYQENWELFKKQCVKFAEVWPKVQQLQEQAKRLMEKKPFAIPRRSFGTPLHNIRNLSLESNAVELFSPSPKTPLRSFNSINSPSSSQNLQRFRERFRSPFVQSTPTGSLLEILKNYRKPNSYITTSNATTPSSSHSATLFRQLQTTPSVNTPMEISLSSKSAEVVEIENCENLEKLQDKEQEVINQQMQSSVCENHSMMDTTDSTISNNVESFTRDSQQQQFQTSIQQKAPSATPTTPLFKLPFPVETPKTVDFNNSSGIRSLFGTQDSGDAGLSDQSDPFSFNFQNNSSGSGDSEGFTFNFFGTPDANASTTSGPSFDLFGPTATDSTNNNGPLF